MKGKAKRVMNRDKQGNFLMNEGYARKAPNQLKVKYKSTKL